MTSSKYTLVGQCDIHASVRICDGAIIGKPFRPLASDLAVGEEDVSATVLARDVYIGYYSLIGAGSQLAEHVIVDDQCTIECAVTVAKRSLIIYRAQICNEAHIGSECVIGGFVAERTRIGDKVRVFGHLVHQQHDPSLNWDSDESMEESAEVEDGVFVGFGAQVIGPVRLGKKSYVCCGAIVTKEVPPGHIAFGVNQIVQPEEWKGRLKTSKYFRELREDEENGRTVGNT